MLQNGKYWYTVYEWPYGPWYIFLRAFDPVWLISNNLGQAPLPLNWYFFTNVDEHATVL